MHIAEHNHCYMHYFGVKTLSETLFPPPLMKPGYGARSRLRGLVRAAYVPYHEMLEKADRVLLAGPGPLHRRGADVTGAKRQGLVLFHVLAREFSLRGHKAVNFSPKVSLDGLVPRWTTVNFQIDPRPSHAVHNSGGRPPSHAVNKSKTRRKSPQSRSQ